MWINDGAGQFFDVAQVVGVTDTYDGRAVALGDFWNHGMLDVVVVNQKGPLLLYKNTVTPDNKWIAFDLEGSAATAGDWGAGAVVGMERGVQEEKSGGSGSSPKSASLAFRSRKQPHIEKVVIRWPSESARRSTRLIGQIHHLKEPV